MELQYSTPMASLPLGSSSSYWCFQCTRAVAADAEQDDMLCPHCHSGFLQPQPMNPIDSSAPPTRPGFTRRRRSGFSFNPLVVLRNQDATEDGGAGTAYELYYDDGDGLGLRPLPPAVTASLLGSGLELMLDRLSQIGFSLWARSGNPPASKRAVAALPIIEITPSHVDAEAHCAVCTDAFDRGSEARELPCKHIFHQDCIVPWLDLHSSCPVCRLKLPSDDPDEIPGRAEPFGLTLWRLPGRGFAVGRFVGASNGEIPTVFSEMDGQMDLNPRVPPEIEWIRRRRTGRLRRFLGNLGSVFCWSPRVDTDTGRSV